MNIEPGSINREFELRGVDHLSLICSDMKRTIAFYGDVLGMPLLEDIELPDGKGHHFIFDVGKGAFLAFFYFDWERKGTPMAAAPHRRIRDRTSRQGLSAANSSICHVAFDVPAEKIDDYLERLRTKGVRATVVNFDASPNQRGETATENTIGRSIYFMDPDGVMLEFATKSPAAAEHVRIVGAGSEAQRPPGKPLAANAKL